MVSKQKKERQMKNSKRGFYADCEETNSVIFIEVKKEVDIEDYAEKQLSQGISAYVSFEGKELNETKLKDLKELSVSVYIGIMARLGDDEQMEFFGVTKKELEVYNKINLKEVA